MANGGRSNTFLIGRIYERVKDLPEMKKDIKEVKKEQQNLKVKSVNDFHEIRGIKKRVRRIENTSISCKFRHLGKLIYKIITR